MARRPNPLTLSAHPSEGHDWSTGEAVVVLHPSNERVRLAKSGGAALAHLNLASGSTLGPGR